MKLHEVPFPEPQQLRIQALLSFCARSVAIVHVWSLWRAQCAAQTWEKAWPEKPLRRWFERACNKANREWAFWERASENGAG